MPSTLDHSLRRRYRVGYKYWLLVTLLTASLHSEDAFHPPVVIARRCDGIAYLHRSAMGGRSTKSRTCLSTENSRRDEKNVGNWLETASRLRKEVQEMETTMSRDEEAIRKQQKSELYSESFKQRKNKIMYTSLEDSSWTMSYRFASEPTKKDREESSPALNFYSGKVSIKFRNDGYTDIINEEGLENSPGLQIVKFWGWDMELSNEDNLEYLEFSADVLLPSSDINHDSSGKASRFYFNARVDKDSNTGEITFSDGTVTLKRDVEPPAGIWGIFNAGGILAQFQYCGEFLCKVKEF